MFARGLRFAVVVLVAAAASLAAVPAHAAQSKERERVRELKSQLRDTRATLRRTSRTLRTTERALTDTRAQVAALQQELASRTAEREAAKAAGRRPSALATAVEQVRREVAHGQLLVPSHPREALIANAAMNYVTGHVTAPAYGYMNRVLGIRPLPFAENVLQAGAGICGHAALTFAAIVKRFNIPVRSVQFYYADGINNHIANEVYYAGDWHYFDPTWGAYYADGSDVLSITDARSRTDAQSLLRQDDTLFWREVQRIQGVVPELGAETDPATRVELDKQKFRD